MKTMQELSSDFIFLICFLELEFTIYSEKLKNIKMLTLVISYVYDFFNKFMFT